MKWTKPSASRFRIPTYKDLTAIKRALAFAGELAPTWQRGVKKYTVSSQKRTDMVIDKVKELPGWIEKLGRGERVEGIEQNIHVGIGPLHPSEPKVQWLWHADALAEFQR